MLGNETIARGAWEAGAKASSAYPGTPSTEVSENFYPVQIENFLIEKPKLRSIYNNGEYLVDAQNKA